MERRGEFYTLREMVCDKGLECDEGELNSGNGQTKMRAEVLDLVKKISGQQGIIVLPRLLVDITLDVNSALLLSQLIYWSDRTSDEDGWIYKSHKDWQVEIGLNRYFVDKARKRLIELGLIEVKLKRAHGSPTVHFRVKGDVLNGMLNSLLERSKVDFRKWNCQGLTNGIAKVSQMELSKFRKSLTEITTETTTETTAEGGDNSTFCVNELFRILERIPAFPRHEPAERLRELQADYPNLNYRLEFKKFAAYWGGGRKKLKRPWLALRNWLEKAQEGYGNGNSKKHRRELPEKYTQPPAYKD